MEQEFFLNQDQIVFSPIYDNTIFNYQSELDIQPYKARDNILDLLIYRLIDKAKLNIDSKQGLSSISGEEIFHSISLNKERVFANAPKKFIPFPEIDLNDIRSNKLNLNMFSNELMTSSIDSWSNLLNNFLIGVKITDTAFDAYLACSEPSVNNLIAFLSELTMLYSIFYKNNIYYYAYLSLSLASIFFVSSDEQALKVRLEAVGIAAFVEIEDLMKISYFGYFCRIYSAISSMKFLYKEFYDYLNVKKPVYHFTPPQTNGITCAIINDNINCK
jgi:hypothetical protein